MLVLVLDPLMPHPSDRWREYELIEELGEFLGVDVVPYVRLGAFTEYLLVDAQPICAHSHVVSHDWITPSHMDRKRDGPSGCWHPIERLGDRHRTSCGSERQTSRSCHCSKSTAVALMSLVTAKVQLSSPELDRWRTVHFPALQCASPTLGSGN